MADQRLPNYEDLEPEGEDHGMSPKRGKASEDREDFEAAYLDDEHEGLDYEDFDYEDLDEFEEFEEYAYPARRLGEAAFEAEDFEDLEDDEALEDEDVPSRRQRRAPLSDEAARAAMAWGAQATTGVTLRKRNGSRGAHARPAFEDLFEDDALYDVGLNRYAAIPDAAMESWSAALVEDYELMESLARVAALTESEPEALGLVAAMVPLAVRLEPVTYRSLWVIVPVLVRGALGAARLLHRRPATRARLRMMPTVLRRTVSQLARRARYRRPISRRLAARALARNTAATMRRGRRKRRPR